MVDLHKYRCETCSHLSTSNYEVGSGYCLKSKSRFLMTDTVRVVIDEMGCASHSSVTPEQYKANTSKPCASYCQVKMIRSRSAVKQMEIDIEKRLKDGTLIKLE